MDYKYNNVSSRVVGNRFSLYPDDEIERIGVKSITSPITFDNLGLPTVKFVQTHINKEILCGNYMFVNSGLYDKAMGVTEFNEVCETCGNGELNCPGLNPTIDLLHLHRPFWIYPLMSASV